MSGNPKSQRGPVLDVSPICDKRGCGHATRYQPVLLLRVHANHPPARVVFGLGLCEDHGAEAVSQGAESLLTDEGWAKIILGVRAAGGADPKRKLTGIELQEVQP